MADKKYENAKNISDDELKGVAGGDYEPEKVLQERANDIQALLEALSNSIQNFGETFLILQKAIETNTCPVCSGTITPGVERADIEDFVNHYLLAHTNKQ
jgi:hypothetical protein